jgi:hypothetical protein
MDETRSLRPGLYAAAALVAASTALILASPAVPPMDDVYIHLVYGRSLLTADPLCFNEGQPSSGFTSPLWLAASAPASTAAAAAPLFLMALSLAAAACALLLPLPRAAPLLVLTGPFLFHSSSGMETGLACLLAGISWVRLSGRPREGRDGVVLAVSGLCRPEFFLLAVPYLIRTVRSGRTGPAGILRLLGPPAAAGVLWVLWNLHATGLPLPSAFYAKADAPGEPLLLARALLIASPLTLLVGLAGSAALAARGRYEGTIPVLLLAAGLMTQPNPWFLLRYYTPFLFTCGIAAASLLGSGGSRRRIVLAACLLLQVPGLFHYGRIRMLASMDVEAIDVMPALYVRDHPDLGGEGGVAVADAGAMGWLAGTDVVDVDGLVTPSPGDVDSILGSVTRAVLFPRQYSDLIEEAGTRLVPVIRFSSPSPVICGEESVVVFEVVGDSDRERNRPAGSGAGAGSPTEVSGRP